MNTISRLTKRLTVDSASKLHFILSHKVNITQNQIEEYFKFDESADQTIWIENVEGLLYNGYDITRCLDAKSPFSSSIKQLSTLPPKTVECPHIPVLSLGGRISVVKHSALSSPAAKELNIRFCVLETSDRLSLRAVLHYPELKSDCLAATLGISCYTESEISASFSGFTGLAWKPSPQPPTEPADHVTIPPDSDVITPRDSDVITPHDTHLPDLPELKRVSPDTIQKIAELTEDQGATEDDVWRLIRNKRITASLFGLVLNAIDKGKYPNHLYNSLLKVYDLSRVAAIKWGNDHEDDAKLAYEKVTGVTVESSGLWLHSSGILGASPDGLLPDGKGLVEFKCPYSLRDSRVEDEIGKNTKFYLKKDRDGQVYLDKNHTYFHQVQGMMHIIDREYCDFCVWTPSGPPYILRIPRDPDWKRCLVKLINFYFKQFLPRVTGEEAEERVYEEYLRMVGSIESIMEDSAQKRVQRRARKRGGVSVGEVGDYPHGDIPALTQDHIVNIAAITSYPLDKHPPKLWYALREHRLTSSMFHRVLAAVSRDTFPASLYKNLLAEYYMGNTDIAKLLHSSTIQAVRCYQGHVTGNHGHVTGNHGHVTDNQGHVTGNHGHVTGNHGHVTPGGIWLDKSGVLGASVAGLTSDNRGIIDVRCLFKYKDITSIEDIIKLEDANFHLYYNSSGAVDLKPSHRFYSKIQGSLHLSGREYCDCITWTQKLYHVTRVSRDPNWAHNLEVIRKFYFEKMFPKLCEKWGFENVIKDLKRFGDVPK